jgi:hypothetical protein
MSVLFALLLTQVEAQKKAYLPAIHDITNTKSDLNFKIRTASEEVVPQPQETEQTETDQDQDREVMAPPANDDCTGGLAAAYTLVPNTSCGATGVNGTTRFSTLNGSDTYGCLSPNPGYTVWFSFVATQANMDVSVRGESGNLCGQTFGVVVWKYAGVCPPSSAPVGCTNYAAVSSQYIYTNVDLTGLTIGATYVIMVAQQSGCNPAITGKFCIGLHLPTTCTTCSSPCGPLAVSNSASDPGVPWAVANAPIYAYHQPLNEFDTSTMCWTFTADNATMYMGSGVDVWCSGPNTLTWTYSLYNSSCSTLISSGNVFSSNQLTGLTSGQNYIICYTTQAFCVRDTIWPYLWGASVLPIELLSFDAKAGRDGMDIFWTTVSEVNTSEFVVEKTRDGQNFTEIKKIKAAGNSTSILNYKVTDKNPLEGNNYYRLKEIDFDGKVAFGKLIAARFIKNNNELSVIPNPAQNEIGINYFSDKDAMTTISVIDVKGVLVLTKNIIADYDGANNILLDISRFQPGIYSVLLVNADKNLNIRFVKQ